MSTELTVMLTDPVTGLTASKTALYTVNAKVPFGGNITAMTGMGTAGITNLTAERVFVAPAQSLKTGAAIPIPAPGVRALCVSSSIPIIGGKIDVPGFITGLYDSAWISFCRSARAGNLVTIGQEFEAGAHDWTPAQIVALHQRAYHLFKVYAVSTAKYGQCFTAFTSNPASTHYTNRGNGGPSGTGCSQWMSCKANGGANDLDFYAIDGYQGNSDATVADVYDLWYNDISTKVANPEVAIFECNASAANQSKDNPVWFTQVYEWAVAHKALAYCVFYGSGTWTGSPKTIAAFKAIAMAQ